ncbi:hypothetical protein AAW00_04085 [Aurantiacibacter luteus]|uniref:Lipoprotein n=2 Tax=Aurantiacibacter luteus TaxID=1581420 RepID=A0A0G9N229_9SPHN|nr:hypothetical protein AAW00_04085 [Aurantiacibacter luteus]
MLALVACNSEPDPQTLASPTPTPTVAGPRTLIAAGFDEQKLGPRIVGPDGDEVTSTVSFEGRDIAEIVSYVACPPIEVPETSSERPAPPAPISTTGENDGNVADFTNVCEPGMQGEGALFTYVHRVTPAEGADGPVLSFRTSRRATGFANAIGFDRDQAEAALGEGYAIGVQIDNGQLIWRIEKGDGWTAGEEITFFWQSELPPEGPAEAYEIETAEGRARGSGPWPPAMPEPEGTENLPAE